MADKKKVEQGSAAMSSTSGAETAVDASASGGGARPKTKEQKITGIPNYFLLVEIGKEKSSLGMQNSSLKTVFRFHFGRYKEDKK